MAELVSFEPHIGQFGISQGFCGSPQLTV